MCGDRGLVGRRQRLPPGLLDQHYVPRSAMASRPPFTFLLGLLAGTFLHAGGAADLTASSAAAPLSGENSSWAGKGCSHW